MAYAINDPDKHWPDNVIRYVISDKAFPPMSGGRDIVQNAIDAWNVTCGLRLVPAGGDKGDYVEFVRHPDRCRSDIGRQGNRQEVRCAVGVGFHQLSVMHEIGHAAGLYHEHQRPDRDEFVIVDPAAFDATTNPKGWHNYNIIDGGVIATKYDCESIMHYSEVPGFITTRPEGCKRIGPKGALTCQDVIATGILGVTAAAKQPLLIGTPVGRTREACNDTVVYDGTSGDVIIKKGDIAIVPVDATKTSTAWGCPSPQDQHTAHPKGTNYLLVVRSKNAAFDVFFID